MIRINVVMITYRGGDAVTRSLEALSWARARRSASCKVDMVVVDNASRDDTTDRVRRHAPWAQLIESTRNVGFAAACNIGIRSCAGADLIVLLNPDVEVRPDFFARLAALDWPGDVAARGPAVIGGHGELEQSARGFPRARTGLLGRSSLLARVRPNSRLLRRDLVAALDEGARPVDWVSGACMIIPMSRVQLVGRFDERYFMYWEDADWCYRAHSTGYVIIYEPALVVTHRQGASSKSRSLATTLFFHRSAFLYWRSNVAKSRVSVIGVAAALSFRCALKLVVAAARLASARLGRGARDRP